jgi:hypothetical protein
MESVHELAEVETDGPGPHLLLVQSAEEVETVRCPTCKGLRSVAKRHVTRNGKVCLDCRNGKVIPKSQFHNYWLARFSMEEIEEMARQIWS